MKRKETDINFIFFSLASTGGGISGGDRIFIELAHNWSKEIPIDIFTTEEGVKMCERQQLKTGNKLTIHKAERGNLPSNFFLKYLYKIFLGIKLGLSLPTTHNLQPTTFVYSSSDFWMDVIPGIILKIRYPKLKWIASWYQTAPSPLVGYTEHRSLITDRKREQTYILSALLYWLSQLPVKTLIKKFSDYVIVNNEDERKRFSAMDKKGKVFVLLGAVRLDEIERYKTSHRLLITDHKSKIYSAVFQGRFHPQKGVVELIDIWRKVVDKIPDAKLAMIGDGPLMENVKLQIANAKLEKNVKLFGYVFDGDEKYKIFSQSKIVVHPSFYDSGGMASAEAMVFSLPLISFNLKAYESYYPSGRISAKIGDLDEFSKLIIKLLVNPKLRSKIGLEAKKLIERNYSWEDRSKELLNFIYEKK